MVVTCDDDFRSRSLRLGAYTGRGVDVIFCTRQPSGLRQQLELVVFNYFKWVTAIETARRRPQLWLQYGVRGAVKPAR